MTNGPSIAQHFFALSTLENYSTESCLNWRVAYPAGVTHHFYYCALTVFRKIELKRVSGKVPQAEGTQGRKNRT